MHDAVHRGEVGVQDGVEYGGDCARRSERGVSEAADGEAGVPVGAWDIVERRMQGWRLEEGEPLLRPRGECGCGETAGAGERGGEAKGV